MQKVIIFLNKIPLLIINGICLLLCSCNPQNSKDVGEKGGYSHKYPDLTPKSSYPSVEKPDVEEEFFEADKH